LKREQKSPPPWIPWWLRRGKDKSLENYEKSTIEKQEDLTTTGPYCNAKKNSMIIQQKKSTKESDLGIKGSLPTGGNP